MWYNLDKLARDRQTHECDLPPIVKFNYAMKFPWQEVINAQLTKYQYETRATFSNICEVEQIDADTIVIG